MEGFCLGDGRGLSIWGIFISFIYFNFSASFYQGLEIAYKNIIARYIFNGRR